MGKKMGILGALGLLVLIVSFENCGQVAFQNGNPVAAESTPCTPSVVTTNENVRILFMVDNSGSTATNSKSVGTDPNKYYRVKVIQNFLAQYGSKPNLNYSFGYFAAAASEYDTSTSSFVASPKSPVGTSADLSAALTAFEPVNAASDTSYQAAITSVQNVIDSVAKPNDGWKYAVVFMSDGSPTDLTPGLTSAQQVAAVQSMVSSLMSHAQGLGIQLSFNTVYFGPETSTKSIANLQGMAQTGSGQFVDTNVVQDVTIDDEVQVPGACVQP